ncbi:MAG: transporter [Rufibacter sp.]
MANIPLLAQNKSDSLKLRAPLETDRPDQTEASSVVPKGTLQIELGLLHQVTSINGQTTRERLYPTTLFRWGLLEQLELRLILEYQSIRRTSGSLAEQKEKGLNALAVGTKIAIQEEDGLLPQMAFIGHLTLPTGSSAFKPTYVAPDFRFSFSHTLSKSLSLGYNLGYAWDGESPAGSAIYSLALGADLSDKWGTYAEVFGEKPEDGKWQHSADAGFTYSPVPNLQLDLSAGLGLTDTAPDYYASLGFGFRIPR